MDVPIYLGGVQLLIRSLIYSVCLTLAVPPLCTLYDYISIYIFPY